MGQENLELSENLILYNKKSQGVLLIFMKTKENLNFIPKCG